MPDGDTRRGWLAGEQGADGDARAQLSLTLVEAAVASLLILAVAAAIGMAPTATRGTGADAQAADAAALLGDVPADGAGTLLGAACSSSPDFDARRERLLGVLDASLPDEAFVSLRTPVGTAGTPPPDTARTGSARVVVRTCTATLVVWYP